MYSGHPLGLFPSSRNAPRVIVTNGMVIPNYSKPDDWERMNAVQIHIPMLFKSKPPVSRSYYEIQLGVSQYGQMTAGSYMYIGPQGIVHGTTITLLNASRLVREKQKKQGSDPSKLANYDPKRPSKGLLFVTSGTKNPIPMLIQI